MTLLNFSDDESDEESRTPVTSTTVVHSEPERGTPRIRNTSVRTTVATKETKSRFPIANQRSRVSTRLSTRDEETHAQSDEDEKENASTGRRVTRRSSASKLSRVTRRHSQPSEVTPNQNKRRESRSHSKSKQPSQAAHNVHFTRSSLPDRSIRTRQTSATESRTENKTAANRRTVINRQR